MIKIARGKGDKMIFTEWKDFKTDSEYYTKKSFEEEINDRFNAMYFDAGDQLPKYIWTDHYVVMVKNNTRMINDISFIKIPRHPECS